MDDSRLFPFWGKPVEIDSEFLEVALSETEDLALVETPWVSLFFIFSIIYNHHKYRVVKLASAA